MSKFNQFFSKAIANPTNVSQVETVMPTTNLAAAYQTIASFVNGALSRIQFQSWFYISGDNVISVSGRKDLESIDLLTGFYYFTENTQQNLWESTEIYKFPISASTQYISLDSDDKEVLGVLLTLSATNQTNGQATITSKFDGFIGTREIMIGYDSPCTVFIPCRSHKIQQENVYSVTGTGTLVDPFILKESITLTDEQSQSLFAPKVVAPTTDDEITITYQNMYVEVEMIPNFTTYLAKFFR